MIDGLILISLGFWGSKFVLNWTRAKFLLLLECACWEFYRENLTVVLTYTQQWVFGIWRKRMQGKGKSATCLG